jgi:hypothetical protein
MQYLDARASRSEMIAIALIIGRDKAAGGASAHIGFAI